MDIYSKGEYPACMLSNFAAHEFEIDGVKCGSMEGFLQSLKFKSVKKQIKVCAMVGKEAKEIGSKKHLWKLTHNVWWQGRKIKRTDVCFTELISRAYSELAKNPAFSKALLDTGSEDLTHSIGSHDPKRTILTEEEFISQLMCIRAQITK